MKVKELIEKLAKMNPEAITLKDYPECRMSCTKWEDLIENVEELADLNRVIIN